MFVNDPTGICIVPITQKYYSDTLIVVPINSYIPKLLMVVNQIMQADKCVDFDNEIAHNIFGMIS